MKELPIGMQAHLDSGATTLCWCWRLERRDGVSLGFTDHDESVTFEDVTYEAFSGFTPTEIETSLGLAVDNLDVAGALSSGRLDERDINAGLYDAAKVQIWRVNWEDVTQRVLMRSGEIGEITRGEVAFRAEMRGLASGLQQSQGRIYQPTCDAMVGDQRCGVNLASGAYRGTGTVSSVDGANAFTATGLSGFSEGWFNRGLLQFSSGANAGLFMQVQSQRKSGGLDILTLWMASNFPVAVGDAFSVTAGCDKTAETCRTKFANIGNFRGFPHMPGNDFIVRYPNKGEGGNDGSTRFDQF